MKPIPIIACGLIAVIGLGFAAKETPEQTIGEYTTSLRGREANQRHNASLCLQKIDGKWIAPGEEFSFNDTVGSWSRDQGYRRAPVSFGGQLVDAWGGGVCQSSTTLYNAALMAGFEIVERNPHHYAPNYVDPGRDAAVAFPNIDLVIKNPYKTRVRISARIHRDQIEIKLEGAIKEAPQVVIEQRRLKKSAPAMITVGEGSQRRVRNIGKPGFEVETYRLIGDQKELLSRDSYPVMHSVVERS
ncbi:MAG: VanW family protein [Armatimonadetes bacterium]|nr:VanW family protein [Armatimonadota bacterium]